MKKPLTKEEFLDKKNSEMLKNGELVFKDENKLPKEQRKIIDDFSKKGFSIIKGKKIYLKDVGHLDIKEIV